MQGVKDWLKSLGIVSLEEYFKCCFFLYKADLQNHLDEYWLKTQKRNMKDNIVAWFRLSTAKATDQGLGGHHVYAVNCDGDSSAGELARASWQNSLRRGHEYYF